MASSATASAGASASMTGLTTAPPRSYFETQRAVLLAEIEMSLEHVLANINKLNRNLEGVIAVGNEFGSVEALWSQFENVMAKDPDAEAEGGDGKGEEDGDTEHHDEGEAEEMDEEMSEEEAGRR